MAVPRINRNSDKPAREAYYVRIKTPRGHGDENLMPSTWVSATEHIGKVSPITKPIQTVFYRVYSDVVTYSSLQVSKKASAGEAREVKVPTSMLVRALKRAREVAPELGQDEVLVEIKGLNAVRAKLVRDENDVVTLEVVDGAVDTPFKIGLMATSLTIFLRSPKQDRILAVAWTGFPGKPAAKTSVLQVAARALNTLRDLAVFRLLADIQKVEVPSLPDGPMRSVVSTKVVSEISMVLWTDDEVPALVASGNVSIEVDQRDADHIRMGFLIKMTPDAVLGEHFDAYRSLAADTISAQLLKVLGKEDTTQIVTLIVLGEAGEDEARRVVEALSTIEQIQLNPTGSHLKERQAMQVG